MKAQDLMICDLVRVDCPIIYKTQKADYSIHGICKVSNIDCTDDDNTIEVEEQEGSLVRGHEITPILLTKEILEANGIKYQWGENWYQLSYPHEVVIGDQLRMRFAFVHELQHALRLCGLIELADNFKIE